MSFEEEYTAWLKKVAPELKGVFEILRIRLSDEPEKLIKDLATAESFNARCSYLLAQANSFLDKAGLYYLPSKDESLRALDRKVSLESSMSHIREMRDKIDGIVDSIKQRLILGESILRYMSQFNSRSHNTGE